MNMQQMVQAMQKAQREFNKEYLKIEEKEFKVSSNGAIEITLLGNFTVKEIKILDADLVKPENKEELEDMLVIAFNKAKEQIQAENDELTRKFQSTRGGFGF